MPMSSSAALPSHIHSTGDLPKVAWAKGSYVYVVGPQNKVLRRDVTVGDVTDAGVTILLGLTGQEAVVVSAGAFLNPGESINPKLIKSAG
jgi:multidrug efflux pump subunit AcrA (membrane-fusion protein)